MFSTSGRYHEYVGVCSVHQGDIMMHVGDTMSTLGMFSTLGDTMSTSEGYYENIGGYHEYIVGCSVHRVFNRN